MYVKPSLLFILADFPFGDHSTIRFFDGVSAGGTPFDEAMLQENATFQIYGFFQPATELNYANAIFTGKTVEQNVAFYVRKTVIFRYMMKITKIRNMLIFTQARVVSFVMKQYNQIT